MSFNNYIKRAAAFLRARTPIGGLEISDAALRFAVFDGRAWKFTSVRLPPGLMESNHVKNRAEFVEAVRRLRTQIVGADDAKRNSKISAVVSLSSISIYTQVFGLPIIQGENLEKAVQLNVQMVSPVEVKEAYSGWQLVGEDKDAFRLEILSAFVDRKVVDEVTQALEEGGFVVVAIESRALGLARLVRERGVRIDVAKPYVLVNLDAAGLDFLVLRRGHLYFEYFHSWKDAQNEKQQVTRETFEALLKRSLYQVLNFYGAHWPEPIREVLVSSSVLREETVQIIGKNFGLAVEPLTITAEAQFTPEWFVAIGSALRGLMPRSEDKDISLLGIGAQERFRNEQLLSFLGFWRVVIPAAVSLLLLSFASADVFLINMRRGLESQAAFQLKKEELAEINALQGQAARFNQTVGLIQAAKKTMKPKTAMIEKISALLEAHRVTLNRLHFQDEGTPLTLSGEADSETDILSFKKALEDEEAFESVELPLTEIRRSFERGFSFSLRFALKS
ncbi:MAG: hypothetical protein HYW65_03450 [Candidatus Liptonbacteria bacterium]|nr:hypothetical protein [Candidatus Liptonbacteria bacterium]